MHLLEMLDRARPLDTFEVMALGWILDDLAANDNEPDKWPSATAQALQSLINQSV